ncbi:1-acyl-sn-glycerol-3-phosphate acyltransferase [Jannaschia sp. 2305UL9-9]|uniref:1-acyl-sn-glycerol-3-phosphate acyltransferase n=1 Tax=Jannaschia sp. 2305UL9-9 TaxID=3121638 RepID=UPI0035272A57
MRDRLDPMIAERAPWLFGASIPARSARFVLDRMLAYERSVEIGTHYIDQDVPAIMADLARRIARRVTATGLDNVPTDGPALVVANHPTGIADGIILHDLLLARRSDAFYYANSDILRVLPQFKDMIVPVEWREEKRSVTKTRETMTQTRKALDDGRLGVIFPSGRLAKRRGLQLHERPWMASAAMIARKFKLPVIPVHIRSRNSAMFYAFDAIHPTLRDITLFHETLNKDVQPYHVTVGRPIDGSVLPKDAHEGIEVLRRATLSLGNRRHGEISLTQNRPGRRWLPRPVGAAS